MDVDRARTDLARAARVLRRWRYIDLMGQVSVRLDPEVFAITPGYGPDTPPPGLLTPDDILLVHRSGRILSQPHNPPHELALHLEIYEQRPDVGSVVVGSPPTAHAYGIVGRQIKPLTHSQSWLAHQGAAMIDPVGFVNDTGRAKEVVTQLGSQPVAHIRGWASVFAGKDLTAAVRLVDAYEYLARIDLIADHHSSDPQIVSREHAQAIDNNRSGGETLPSRDPNRYFASFDDVTPLPPPSPDPIQSLKEKVALSCRVLASQGSLVAFFEHVSQRLPGGSTFLMSPAKNFAHMEADDIGVISLDDECLWLSGPYPPAPFRFYHSDVLRARPDVDAIVHTHEMYGRALTMAGVQLAAVSRIGVQWARQIPTFSTPTMGFKPEDRRALVETLGTDSTIHILAHGTDYLATSMEEATVMAVQREALARIMDTALRLGEPAVLDPAVIQELEHLGPTPDDWWRCYLTDI